MFASFMVYLLFFTRISIPYEIKNFEKSYKQGVWLLPIFGFVYAVLPASVYLLFLYLLKDISLAWILSIVSDIMLTGALHYDGIADMADGIFSGRSKERMKEIMRDSRIGSFGTLALLSYILILHLAGVNLLDEFLEPYMQALVICGLFAVGKAGMTFLLINYKYANSEGQGKIAEGISPILIAIAQVISLLIIYFIFAWSGVLAYIATLLFLELYKLFITKKIDGMTGDTLGAGSALSIPIFILVYLIINNFI